MPPEPQCVAPPAAAAAAERTFGPFAIPDLHATVGVEVAMADAPVYRMTEILAGLSRTASDAARGFTKAAGLARNADLARMLTSFADQRLRHHEELAEIVSELGVDAPDSGTASAGFHRAWLELTHDVDGHDRPILVECLRAEHHAKHKYDLAAELILPRQANDAIDRHKADIAEAIGLLEGRLSEAIVRHHAEIDREDAAFAKVLELREGPRLDNA